MAADVEPVAPACKRAAAPTHRNRRTPTSHTTFSGRDRTSPPQRLLTQARRRTPAARDRRNKVERCVRNRARHRNNRRLQLPPVQAHRRADFCCRRVTVTEITAATRAVAPRIISAFQYLSFPIMLAGPFRIGRAYDNTNSESPFDQSHGNARSGSAVFPDRSIRREYATA